MTLPCGAPSTAIPALHLESSGQNCATSGENRCKLLHTIKYLYVQAEPEQLSLLRPNGTRFGQSKTGLPSNVCVRWRCFWFPATMAVQLGERFVILPYFFHIIWA